MNKRHHKNTLMCPIKGCKYTSREMISIGIGNSILKKTTLSSRHCPKHRVELVSIGSAQFAVNALKIRKA